jgi:hypothetical protein
VPTPPAASSVGCCKLPHQLLPKPLLLLLLWLPGIYPACIQHCCCSNACCAITACYFHCLQRQAPPLAAVAAAALAALHPPYTHSALLLPNARSRCHHCLLLTVCSGKLHH